MISTATSTLAEQPARPSRSAVARPLGVYDSTGALVGLFTNEVVYIPFGDTEIVRAYALKQTFGSSFVTYFASPKCGGTPFVLPMHGGPSLSSDRSIIINNDLSSSIYTGRIPSPTQDVTIWSLRVVSIFNDGTVSINCNDIEGGLLTLSPFVGQALPFVPPYTLR